MTLISLLTMLSLMNNTMLMAPRILYGIGRDGLFTKSSAAVSEGGTPRVALAITFACVVVIVLTGSFEQIVALFAVLFLVYYIAAFLAVFVMRYRFPTLSRPYKALGYPFSTSIVLVGSIAFLIAAVVEDSRSGIIAGLFIAACAPAYALMARSRRLRVSAETS